MDQGRTSNGGSSGQASRPYFVVVPTGDRPAEGQGRTRLALVRPSTSAQGSAQGSDPNTLASFLSLIPCASEGSGIAYVVIIIGGVGCKPPLINSV